MSQPESASPPQVRVSVVVPSFRSRATIADTLQSLLQQKIDEPLEVLVVDSSDDGTDEALRRDFPQVQVHHSDRRLWPGAARNRGAELARGDFLAFLDADASAPPGWLSSLLGIAENRPGVRMAGAAVQCANPHSAAARVLYWIEFSEFLPGGPSGQRRALSSSNLLVRRRDFQHIGGFNEEFAMAEDLILCRRLGGPFCLETGLAVLHRQRDEWPEVRRHLESLGCWSGRYRAAFQVRGSGLRRFPLLALALLPLRFWRILRRLRAARPAAVQPSLADLPLLVRGLWAWCRGFQKGLGDQAGGWRLEAGGPDPKSGL